MISHKTRSTRNRSSTRQLAKASFDGILDLTAEVYSSYSFLSNFVTNTSAVSATD